MSRPDPNAETGKQDAPPFGSTWGTVYAVVLGFLALLILLFTIFTISYS